MNLLVVGGSGQIGKALREISPNAVFLQRQELDLSLPSSVRSILEAYWKKEPHVDAIVNAAAYTQVDLAEKETELAFAINSEAVKELGLFCLAHDIPLVHFSTDYVYEGSGTSPWTESDPVNPQNAYGRSKLAGEEELFKLQKAHPEFKFLTFRTSWVYDATGKNFFKTMLRLAFEREEVRVVSDQVGAPCFAGDLARISLDCLKKAMAMKPFPAGVYHLCHKGETSWYEFSKSIFDSARAALLPLKLKSAVPISSRDYPTPAKRPLNSRLSTEKIQTTFGVSLPTWKEGLAKCFTEFNAGLVESQARLNQGATSESHPNRA